MTIPAIRNLIQPMQTLQQQSLRNLSDPGKISQHQAAWAWQHMMILQAVHQIMLQLKNNQHLFKQ